MLEFKKLEFENFDNVHRYFMRDNERRIACGEDIICDSLFGTTFLWRNYYNARFATLGDSAIILASSGGTDMFSFPMGGDIGAMLSAVKKYAHDRGMAVYFCFVSENDLHWFYDTFDVVFPSEEPDWFDYVYDKESITDYRGRAYHGQKNHCNKFKKTFPDCRFSEINSDSARTIINYTVLWYEKYSDGSPMSVSEEKAIIELLENWDIYNMTGGYISDGEKILGFTVGETAGNTVFVHIEKAEHDAVGAYQFLSSEYLRNLSDANLKFVNREEDMGILGLRRSKQSLHPVKMLKKYTLYCC